MIHQYIFLLILTALLIGYRDRADKGLICVFFIASTCANIIHPFSLTEGSFPYIAAASVFLMSLITYFVRKLYTVAIAIILTLCLIFNLATIMTYQFDAFTDAHYVPVKTFTENFIIYTSYVNIAILAFIDDGIIAASSRYLKRFFGSMAYIFGFTDSREVSS